MDKFRKIIYLVLAISAFIFSISFAFSQYIRIKEHNLEVVNVIRGCSKDHNGDTAHRCADVAKKQVILKSLLWDGSK